MAAQAPMMPKIRLATATMAGRAAMGQSDGERNRYQNPASTCQAPAAARRTAPGRSRKGSAMATRASSAGAPGSVTGRAYQTPKLFDTPRKARVRMKNMNNVIAVILGGGRGSRLFPLTLDRSKPAVPIGGKYRLIDIPISNCLNSDVRRMFVLTQYNSESLNKHIGLTYKFDLFTSGFVNILAAEQTEESGEWFQGTADAVRQSLRHMKNHRFKEVLILSGDQLYQMDYRKFIDSHRRQMADVTVAVT